jgi:cytochrome c
MFGLAGFVGLSAVAIANKAADIKTTKPEKVYTEYQCVRCHMNDKAILRMQDKAGNANRWSSFLSKDAKVEGSKCPAKAPSQTKLEPKH